MVNCLHGLVAAHCIFIMFVVLAATAGSIHHGKISVEYMLLFLISGGASGDTFGKLIVTITGQN